MNKIYEIEKYIEGELSGEDAVLMEAKILLNTDLRSDVYWQKQTYALVKQYGRKKLRVEIEAAHRLVFTSKKLELFRQKITSIFKK